MKHQVIVRLRTPGSQPAISPLFDLDQAQAELAKIRQIQETSSLTDLDWLSVNGAEILSAHVEPLLPASARRAA